MEDYLVFIVVIGTIALYKLLSLKKSIDQRTSELIEEKRKLEQKAYKLANEKWELDQEKLIKERAYQKQAEYLKTLRNEFDVGYIHGRKWLAKYIAEADKALDESISLTFRTKKRPAMKATDVSIAPDVALILIRTGTIKKSDWLTGQVYQFADGSKAKSKRFNLRSITIGNKTFKNVTCRIAETIESPMLLGQSVLKKLGRYTIDYKKGVI